MKVLSKLETINHLEGEGNVTGLVNPVDVIVVEARHSLPFVVLVHRIFWQLSAPRHVQLNLSKMLYNKVCFNDLTWFYNPMRFLGR